MTEKAFDLRVQARKTVNYLSVVLFSLLLLSIFTLRDSFTCAGLDEVVCDKARSQLSCKAQVVVPIYATISVTTQPQSYISLNCGWETACSQLRICIVLSALYATYKAFLSIRDENKKDADSFLQAAPIIAFLLITTGLFDLLAVYDSGNDNYGLCQDFTEAKGFEFEKVGLLDLLQRSRINCGFNLFWAIGLLACICGCAIAHSIATMFKYRQSIAIGSL